MDGDMTDADDFLDTVEASAPGTVIPCPAWFDADGGQLTLRNAEGSIVAVVDEPIPQFEIKSPVRFDSCTFEYVVPELPESDFYEIELGSLDPINVTAATMEKQAWKLEYTKSGG